MTYNSKQIWDPKWQVFLKKAKLKINQTVVNQIVELYQGKLVGKKILEVGSGSGSDSIYLAKKKANVTLLDFSKNAIRVAQEIAKRHCVKIKTIKTDCKKIPIKDNYFDLVFSVGLIEHFKQPLPIIKEQLRVLKPNGYLVIDVPQKYNLYTLVKKSRMLRGSFPFGWETEFSPQQLKNLALQLNLKLIKIYGRDSAFRLKIPSSLNPIFNQYLNFIENSTIAPYLCLCIGAVYQKPQSTN